MVAEEFEQINVQEYIKVVIIEAVKQAQVEDYIRKVVITVAVERMQIEQYVASIISDAIHQMRELSHISELTNAELQPKITKNEAVEVEMKTKNYEENLRQLNKVEVKFKGKLNVFTSAKRLPNTGRSVDSLRNLPDIVTCARPGGREEEAYGDGDMSSTG